MHNVEIQLIVDTFLLQKHYASPSQDSSLPTPIKQDEAQIIVATPLVMKTGMTDINVSVGDTIVWSTDSFSSNGPQVAIIYKIEKTSGTPIMSDPEMQVKRFPTPVPHSEEPTTYTLEDQANTFLTSDVLTQGVGSYRIFFYIVGNNSDTKEMTTFGYFCWDTSITATQIIDRKAIDICIAIDTASIIKNYEAKSKPDCPVRVDRDAIYMVANNAVVTEGQATANLSIKAKANDIINWRAESLSGNTDQTAILYDIVKNSEAQITSKAEMQVSYPVTPIPNPNNPTNYSSSDSQAVVFFAGNVLKSGSEEYQVRFYIVDRNQDDGEHSTAGYYYWEATIHVVE